MRYQVSSNKTGPPPKTYQNQTLEQIINGLSSNVESATLQYLTQATRVAQQDALLRDSQRNISELSQNVSKLYVQQEELDRRLSQVGDVQGNLNAKLDGLESQVDILFERTMSTGGADDADKEREKYFNIAMATDNRLMQLEGAMEDLEKQLQGLQDECVDSGSLGNIVQVMNHHFSMLSSLETSCATINSDMNIVQQRLG